MSALEADARFLSGVPISVDLSSVGCLAIVGDRERGRRLAASILTQYFAVCAPTELALVAHLHAEAVAEWQWLKWLPHTRASVSGVDDGRTLIATTAEDFDVVLDQIASPRLEAIERHRAARNGSETPSFRQVVVMVDGYTPSSAVGRLERLDAVLGAAAEIGALVIATVDRRADIPGHAGATIEIGRTGTIDYSETTAQGSCRTPAHPRAAKRWRARLRRSVSGPAGLRRASTAPAYSSCSVSTPRPSSQSGSGGRRPIRSPRRSGCAREASR